ncbi:MAG: hypothetical protein KGQ49_01620 [Verrucomicrobia bacterium]|nr:hypothetical protein [Verrucomicrobiota bacterium]MBU6446080.1 hypothetical protein [Verrucomicrobiota bacterium]MDE3047619.1 hypothetical protein [Verrucomicrobiota bacterium]
MRTRLLPESTAPATQFEIPGMVSREWQRRIKPVREVANKVDVRARELFQLLKHPEKRQDIPTNARNLASHIIDLAANIKDTTVDNLSERVRQVTIAVLTGWVDDDKKAALGQAIGEQLDKKIKWMLGRNGAEKTLQFVQAGKNVIACAKDNEVDLDPDATVRRMDAQLRVFRKQQERENELKSSSGLATQKQALLTAEQELKYIPETDTLRRTPKNEDIARITAKIAKIEEELAEKIRESREKNIAGVIGKLELSDAISALADNVAYGKAYCQYLMDSDRRDALRANAYKYMLHQQFDALFPQDAPRKSSPISTQD